MQSSTMSPLRSFPFIGALLAVFIIAYGSVTTAYAADTVNINTASIEILAEELAGVGPELAKRIVDFRQRYGEFKSIEALGDVRGIGPSLLTKNEEKSYSSSG
jgi:competence protein ComEA